MNVIHIRPPRPGDGPGHALVWTDAGRYYARLDPDTFQIPSTEGLADSFEQRIANAGPDSLHLVADIDSDVAGFLTATLQPPHPDPERQLLRDLSRPRLFVQVLAVAELHRRNGVGTALMTAAEGWARDHDAATISLDTYLRSPLSVPFFRSRPHAPQPSQWRARGYDERPRL